MTIKICFPLTKFFYIEGMKRCVEPPDLFEENDCLGPKDKNCIDCYLCLVPFAFLLDIITFSTCKDFITSESSNVIDV